MQTEAADTEASLRRLKKTSNIISVIFTVVLVVFAALWAAMVVFLGVQFFMPQMVPGVAAVGSVPLIQVTVFGALVVSLLRIAHLIFRDVAKGESPFTMKQIKRIRWVAYILLIYVVIELFATAAYTPVFDKGDMRIGYAVSSGVGDQAVSVNIGMLMMSIIFYCLSLVFEYGTLLQRLSDETL